MCGIAGHFRAEGQADRLDLELLRHRGPDGLGEWRSPNGRVWLGHTRLAILDLSPAGAQPMQDPPTGNVLVFNGEIYNHLAVRRELGIPTGGWRGTSDTETLLAAYRAWGGDMLRRIKGMFAFALYDAADGSLWLVRDRFGIKPLYYRERAGEFWFASEIHALDAARTDPTPEAVAGYLQWGACPEQPLLPPTVRSLPAGSWMRIAGSGTANTESYWPKNRFRESEAPQTREAPAQVRHLLERSVEEHLLADVPVACFLSGGIDSSVVTALAALKMGRALKTFSVGFAGGGYDETRIARQVADRYGTEHERIELGEEEILTAIQEGVRHMDLPSVDAINTYIVSRAVGRRGIKVALSGLGGDELFGGYPSFRDVPRLLWIARAPSPLRSLLSLFGPVGRRLADVPTGGIAEIAAWRRRFWTAAELRDAGFPEPAMSVSVPDGLSDTFAAVSWAELSGYMRHMLLRDSDQMSMAVSLELRVPFLDHELAEYVLRLPGRAKAGRRWVKDLLVESCKDLLPREVYDRPKQGFGLPMDGWMRGPLHGFVQDGIQDVTTSGIIREAFLSKIVRQFEQRKIHWTRLWMLVVLGHWLERAANRRPDANNGALLDCMPGHANAAN